MFFQEDTRILRGNEALPYLWRLLADRNPGIFSYDVYPRTIEFRGWGKTETSLRETVSIRVRNEGNSIGFAHPVSATFSWIGRLHGN